MSPRNVIFDLGGVLLDWNPGRILSQFYLDDATHQSMHDAIFGHPDWVAFDKGQVTKHKLIYQISQRSGRSLRELTRVLEAARNSLTEKPEMVAVLRALHRRGVHLYCLSNMPTWTFRHLRRRFDFWDSFRGIVISGQARLIKPERAIFDHLLSLHHINPADTVFIDDHPPNVAAARVIGLDAILFCSAAECRRDLCARFGWDEL